MEYDAEHGQADSGEVGTGAREARKGQALSELHEGDRASSSEAQEALRGREP